MSNNPKAEYSREYQRGVLQGLKIVSIYAGDRKPITPEAIEAEIAVVNAWPIKKDEEPAPKNTVKIELTEKSEMLTQVNKLLGEATTRAKALTEALNEIPLVFNINGGDASAKG